MPYQRNTETQDNINREISELQSRCAEAYKIIENSPLNLPYVARDDSNEKALCYIEGLRTEIENSNTPIVTDENLLTSQFLNEMKEKTNHLEELTAYTKGAILDIDSEINRLNTLLKTAEEAKTRPKVRKQEVKPQHLQKAKERFHMMKTELHALIHSLFPSNSDMIVEVMGDLMKERLNENSTGYIPITTENFHVIELLKDINIISSNPYNNMEVKLAY